MLFRRGGCPGSYGTDRLTATPTSGDGNAAKIQERRFETANGSLTFSTSRWYRCLQAFLRQMLFSARRFLRVSTPIGKMKIARFEMFETAMDFSFRNAGCGSRAVVSTSGLGLYPAASLVEIGAELDAGGSSAPVSSARGTPSYARPLTQAGTSVTLYI